HAGAGRRRHWPGADQAAHGCHGRPGERGEHKRRGLHLYAALQARRARLKCGDAGGLALDQRADHFVAFAAEDFELSDRARRDFYVAIDIGDAVDFRRVGFGAEGVGFGVFVPAVADGLDVFADHGLETLVGERGLHFHEAIVALIDIVLVDVAGEIA